MERALPGSEDKYLLSQIRQGDTKAFDALYEKYWQTVYNAAFKRLQQHEPAKDITQDVFLQIWLKRADIFIDNVPGYLFTATKNKVLNLMQRERIYTPVSDLFMDLQLSPNQADAELFKKEFLAAYETLIDSLTPSQQQIFRLRYHENLSTQEIADQLNISRKTVQNQLGKAVLQLKSSLALVLMFIMLHNK